MTVPDGRIAAWTAAWHCIETAQQVRIEATKLPENAANLDARRQYHQLYQSLLDEARIFVALTAVNLDVAIGAGAWLDARQRLREQEEERTQQAREDFTNLFGQRNKCADCDRQLTGMDRMQVVNDGGVIYVCPKHYTQRTEGVTDEPDT